MSIDYPSSDGKPMAENDAQRDAIMYGISALTRHFKDRWDVSIASDVFVVFGVEKRRRLHYKLWEECQAAGFRARNECAARAD